MVNMLKSQHLWDALSKPSEDALTMAKIIFLLLSLCAVGVTSSIIEKRLVSAKVCPINERLYHARVVCDFLNGTIINCAGTLIHEKWVITASHCNPGRSGKLKVELGGHPANAEKQLMKIDNVVVYPVSPSDEPIMLLRLSNAAKNIVPATLPPATCMAPGDGDELWVSGRGATNPEGGPGVKDLMCLKVKALSKNHCPDLTGTEFEAYKFIFCGGKTGDADIKACKEDTGSGLLKKETVSKSSYIFFTKQEKVDVLYGVLISGQDQCDDKFVFADLCSNSIRKWISKTLV